jgi:hypothetical protein
MDEACALCSAASKPAFFSGERSFYCHEFFCSLQALLSDSFLQPLMQRPRTSYTGLIENLDLNNGCALDKLHTTRRCLALKKVHTHFQ